MNEEEKTETRRQQQELLLSALREPADFLVLDEACAALQLQMVDEDTLRRAVLEKPREQELVLTGRTPAPWMFEAADYCTEMHCVRHPYEKGIGARRGVEY